MIITTIKDMFDANVHFGHQTNRWNPKMSQYIFSSRNGIHIIDLRKTVILMKHALNFIIHITSRGGKILFIGTKKQARNVILKNCSKTNSFFVHNRWLGGMLTNFNTIQKSINKMNKLEESFQSGIFTKLPKKEISFLSRDLEKLKKSLLGVKNMTKLPEAIFVIDPNYERIAIKEAYSLKIPIIAVADTNCNPDIIDYVIPANDDSIKSISFFLMKAIDACLNGEEIFKKSI
jgi:small subunit ribosomal protein S2